MKYEKAYCKELNKEITAVEAKYQYFLKDDNNKFSFFCTDKNCRAVMSAVLIYTKAKKKKPPHFRIHKKNKHHTDCKVDNANSRTNIKVDKNKYATKKYPDKFTINDDNITIYDNIEDLYFDNDNIVDDESKLDNITKTYTKGNFITTSRLQRVVDRYEGFDNKEHKYINIFNKVISYGNLFKDTQKIADNNLEYIFFDDIRYAKCFGSNYSIYFSKNIYYNGERYACSIYITKELIEKNRAKKYFIKNIEYIIPLDKTDKNNLPRCYFIASSIEKVYVKGYPTLNIHINDLNHIVFLFDNVDE
jgi:hypothetical protein